MRSTLIVSAFAALALGAPRPQEIDFDVVDAAPDPEISEIVSNSVTPPQAESEVAAIVKGSITGTETPEKRDLLSRRGLCSDNGPGTLPGITT